MNGGTSSQPNIADKRIALSENSLKLLSERGFHNSSMLRIVKELGVSTGIVYRCFPNQDETIVEPYQEIKTKLLLKLPLMLLPLPAGTQSSR